MVARKIPNEPMQRRVLIIVNSVDYDRLENKARLHDPVSYDLFMSEEVCIVTRDHLLTADRTPDTRALGAPAPSDAVQRIYRMLKEKAEIGQVYIQDPFEPESGYYLMSDVAVNIAAKKAIRIAGFLYKLGATEIRYLEEVTDEESHSDSLLAKIGIPTFIDGSARIEASMKKKLKQAVDLRLNDHQRANRRIASKEELRKLLDSQLHFLVGYERESLEMLLSAHPHPPNYRMSVSLSADLLSNVKIATSLKIPGHLKLDSSIKEARHQLHAFTFKLDVIFNSEDKDKRKAGPGKPKVKKR